MKGRGEKRPQALLGKDDNLNTLGARAEEAARRAKLVGILSIVNLTLTVLWLICLIVGLSSAGSMDTFERVLSHVAKLDTLFYLTYLNAALLTASVVMLFVLIFIYLRPIAPVFSATGVAFVPIYGCLNLVAYLSQVTVVPRLLRLHAIPKYQLLSEFLLQQTVQPWPDSAVFIFNNLAYAVLGVPSIMFGILMLRSSPVVRFGGILLGLSGVASMAGFIGIVAQDPLVAKGSLVGGTLFLLALVQLSWGFLWTKHM
jgi:hypothetical protein